MLGLGLSMIGILEHQNYAIGRSTTFPRSRNPRTIQRSTELGHSNLYLLKIGHISGGFVGISEAVGKFTDV